MIPDEALSYLDSHTNLGITPGLGRMRAALTLLGDPQLAYPAVHVTGTNAKTTVARIVAAILGRHGLRTGLYTSPHLVEPYERIEIGGVPITPGGFADQMAYLLAYFAEVERSTGQHPSYFEIGTILALSAFADAGVDVAVIEVGLGGALDATNVVDGRVAVITNVDVDHTEYLGADVVGIAREKAGIVKPGATVVSGVTDRQVAAVVAGRCREVGAELWEWGEDFDLEDLELAHGGVSLSVRTPGAHYPDLFLPLLGRHEGVNCAVAVAAAEAFFGRALDEDVLAAGLRGVTSPGRLEVVRRRPLVVLDGAHNPAGVRTLVDALDEVFEYERLVVVCGILADKDVAAMVEGIALLASLAFVTAPGGTDRAADPNALAKHFRDAGVETTVAPSVAAALDGAREAAGPDDLVLVTGSLYTVGEALQGGSKLPP